MFFLNSLRISLDELVIQHFLFVFNTSNAAVAFDAELRLGFETWAVLPLALSVAGAGMINCNVLLL